LRSFGLTGLEQLPELPNQPSGEAVELGQETEVEGQIDFDEL